MIEQSKVCFVIKFAIKVHSVLFELNSPLRPNPCNRKGMVHDVVKREVLLGLFSGIKRKWKKTEAAVIVQNLLENQCKLGMFYLDPVRSANLLVSDAWETMPDVFDGKFGQRPNKLSIAAIALATGIKTSPKEDANVPGLIIALGNILSQVEVNGSFFPFNSIDTRLLASASEVFAEITKEYGLSDDSSNSKRQDTHKLKGSRSNFHYKDFDDWYLTYKEAAHKSNMSLTDGKGLSLLDIMDHDPLHLAYSDMIDPIALGSDFGKNFDILKMR